MTELRSGALGGLQTSDRRPCCRSVVNAATRAAVVIPGLNLTTVVVTRGKLTTPIIARLGVNAIVIAALGVIAIVIARLAVIAGDVTRRNHATPIIPELQVPTVDVLAFKAVSRRVRSAMATRGQSDAKVGSWCSGRPHDATDTWSQQRESRILVQRHTTRCD